MLLPDEHDIPPGIVIMVKEVKQDGMMVTLMQRFKTQRLPRIMEIKEHVDAGSRLSEYDRLFLEEAMHDAQQNIRHVEDIPECQHLFIQLAHLYKQIMDKAIDNENRA
jgi:hypothetical protein